MKSPLSYQTTEYDCGPTTVVNALNFLFQREEIYPDVIKCIMQYTLDSYNEKGEAHKNGTTGMAMMFLSNWLNHFGKVKDWPIQCEMINGREVYIGENSRIGECLQQGGTVVVRVMLGGWHYMLLTGIKGNYVSAFDPYYRKNPFRSGKIKIINNEPKKRNRKIRFDLLNQESKEEYALGDLGQRECMLLYNTTTRRTIDSTDYVI